MPTPLTRLAHPGVRARVLVAVVATVALALVGSVVVLERVLVANVDRRVDEGLQQEVAELQQLADGVDPATSRPFDGNTRRVLDVFLSRNVPSGRETFVTIVDGRLYDISRRSLPALEQDPALARWGTLTAPERDSLDLGDTRFEYLAVPLVGAADSPTATFVVLYDYTAERREVAAAIRRAELVAAGFLLLACVFGWLAAGRALHPLRALTTAAQEVSGDRDLDRRLPDPPGSDEVATLTRTFNGMLDRLEAAFEVQRDFVADAGHELRTPITIVRGHLELMGDDPAERTATVALVTEELERMSRMVDDLLVLARSDRPDFLLPGPVDLEALLRQVGSKAAVLGERTWRVQGPTGLLVQADEQRLTQALMQLAANAVAHTRDGGVVDLGAAAAGDRLQLWVLDDGPGVPVADRDRIFERFARAGTGAARAGGSGLGLSIVAAIARAHGGRVELLSTDGAGAAFVLDLPYRPVPA
ncbi:sensor histidine kinase [Jannaschia sp. R86511]|uniref:sensor histidine kinase n=1 Tax=Jannaschia sp. R86511 TaxID=3093853 RepID=UPI0036D2C384